MNNIEDTSTSIQTLTDLVNETIISTDQYVINAVPLVSKLAERFYQQPTDNSWEQLIDLFEGLQWIIQTLSQIDSIKDISKIVNNYEIWNEYVQSVSKLNDIIPELEAALSCKDSILIGDILLYEIKPAYENMLEKLQFLKPMMVNKDVS